MQNNAETPYIWLVGEFQFWNWFRCIPEPDRTQNNEQVETKQQCMCQHEIIQRPEKQHFIKSVITRVLITFILSQLTGNVLRTLANSGKFLSKFVQHYLIFNNVFKMLAQNVSGYICNHSSLRMGTRHCVLFRGSLWERLQRDRLHEAWLQTPNALDSGRWTPMMQANEHLRA